MLLFVCLFVSNTKQIKLDILPWTMSVDGYRTYLLLSTALKSSRHFLPILCQTIEDNTVYTDVIEVIIIFFIIITENPGYSNSERKWKTIRDSGDFELSG